VENPRQNKDKVNLEKFQAFNLPDEKRTTSVLSYLFGVGETTSLKFLKKHK